ncbi:MAG: serine hydrolase domain-containing protein [Myxococcota bacterium]
MSDATIQGDCNERFGAVRDTFEAACASGAEIGAAVCVVQDGETVVDLWGGFKDAARTEPWQRDTLANVFSTTKGMTALCAHRLVDEGRLDLDAPVATYWPEFAQQGKGEITVRQLISHQAGLPAVRKTLPPEALFDWDQMTDALAAEQPWWTPGTKHGYHAVTFGWLVGEVVRRITGQSLGAYFAKEFAEPLGADFVIGFGPELDARVAPLVQGPIFAEEGETSLFEELLANPESMTARAFNNPPLLGTELPNTREWRAAEIPAANGHASAAGIATIYGKLAAGDLLSQAVLEEARTCQAEGEDAILPLVTKIACGFMLAPANEPCGPNPKAFNHAGAGGSLGYCDPEAKIGLGYVMNNMHSGLWLVDPRARNLVEAVYAGL